MSDDRFWAAVRRYRKMTPQVWSSYHRTYVDVPAEKPCVHFVGFRGDEYYRAIRVFGRPDFIHRYWDHRAIGDILDIDTVVFARGDERDPPNVYAFNDSEHF